MVDSREKVFINGRFLTQQLSGMQRYSEEMVSGVDRLLQDNADLASQFEFEVLCPISNVREVKWKQIPTRKVGRTMGHVWEQVELPLYSRQGILLNLQSAGPVAHAKSILVVHDAGIFAHPEHFTFKYRALHQTLRPILCRKAKGLATISEFSRKEISRFCNVPSDRFEILPDSAEHIHSVVADADFPRASGLTPRRYALFVGNLSPNKNAELAVRAFKLAKLSGWHLAIVGGAAGGVFGEVGEFDDDCVVRLGRVTDEQLKALYQDAGMFLFPSRYEGFGVPPLEAMTLGCPVISSDSSAMPEVLGDAALYFPLNDQYAFAANIQRLAKSEELRSTLVDKGLRQAQKYSWERSSASLVSLIVGVQKSLASIP